MDYKKLKTGLVGSLFLSQAPFSFAYFETLSTAESVLADPIVNAVVNDPLSSLKDDSTEGKSNKNGAIGGEYVNTDNNDIFNLPISYGFSVSMFGGSERLNINANLSYVDTSSPLLTDDESGMGDSTVGLEYSYYNDGLTIIPNITVKLATGDEDDGLGTDSTDIATSIAIKKSFGKAAINGKFAYIFKGDGEPLGTEWDYGDIYTLDLGGRYNFIDSLWIQANVIYVDQDGNELESTGTSSGGLETIDVIPTLTYRVKDMFNINAKYIFAVDEDADSGATAPDREDSFTVSLTAGF